jgi:hypothetical protein
MMIRSLIAAIGSMLGFSRPQAPAEVKNDRWMPPSPNMRAVPKREPVVRRAHTTRNPLTCPKCGCNMSLRWKNCANRACGAYFGREEARVLAERCEAAMLERSLQRKLRRSHTVESADAGLGSAA